VEWRGVGCSRGGAHLLSGPGRRQRAITDVLMAFKPLMVGVVKEGD
jgi:hypothetical protein